MAKKVGGNRVNNQKAEELLKWIAQYDFRKGQVLCPENEAAIMVWPKLAREALDSVHPSNVGYMMSEESLKIISNYNTEA
jgi:hypothetical protein